MLQTQRTDDEEIPVEETKQEQQQREKTQTGLLVGEADQQRAVRSPRGWTVFRPKTTGTLPVYMAACCTEVAHSGSGGEMPHMEPGVES